MILNNSELTYFLSVVFSDVLAATPLRDGLRLRDILGARDGILVPCVKLSSALRYPTKLQWANSQECGCQVDSFLENRIVGDSEQTVVGRDSSWICLIRGLVQSVRIQLNTHDTSSMQSLRPDLSVSCYSAVGLRGEQKSERAMLEVACKELTDKLKPGARNCFPAGHTSIFGITSFPDLILVYEIWYDGGAYGSTLLKAYEIGMYEDHRVEFIIDVVNIIRWLRTIKGHSNGLEHLVLEQEVATPNGHKIFWDGEVIHKNFKKSTVETVVKNIKKVYAAKLAHVEWGKVPANSKRKIVIERVGIPLIQAIRTHKITIEAACAHIRLAIDELHAIGLAHCDVRIENCFFDQRMNVAFLDDLEFLTKLTSAPPLEIWGPLPLPPTAGELDESQYIKFIEKMNIM